MDIRRILTVIIALVAAFLIGLAFAFFLLVNATQQVERTQQQRIDSYLLAYELRQSSDDLTRMARTYAETGDAKYEEMYRDILGIREGRIVRPKQYHRIYWNFFEDNQKKPLPDSDVAISLIDLAKQKGFSKAELAKLVESIRESEALVGIENVALNMVKGKYKDASGGYGRLDLPDLRLANSLLFSESYISSKSKVMKPIDDFFVLMEDRTSREVRNATQAALNAEYLVAALFLFTIVSIVAGVILRRKQQENELEASMAAKKQAEDENEALNDSVINILSAVNQLSQRDLTAKAPVTEDIIGTVSDSINQLSSETAKVLHGVTDIAGQVETVSGNVKQQASLVTQTAKEERDNVKVAIESLLDATQTMNQVAALAEQSNTSAEQVTDATNKALSTVDTTVTGMEQIRGTIAESEKRIKRLGERSQEISGIVNLINTISERTHVLALNASMQAAVAGEAGRGFAVVAEEVQRLAESSRSATEQISTLVNNIQLETNETINTVNNTIAQVVEGSKQAQEAGEQMRITQKITDDLVSQVARITQASEKQKTMSANLLEAVQNIGESTEKTAQQIETQNKQTEMLQQSASELVDSVSVFKLPAKDVKEAS